MKPNLTKGIDKVYEYCKYGYMQSISLNWNIGESGEYEHCLEVLLSADQYNQGGKLRIEFFDVKTFSLREVNGLCFVQINIVDVAAHQMENISYSVTEEEHGLFLFHCRHFTFEEIL